MNAFCTVTIIIIDTVCTLNLWTALCRDIVHTGVLVPLPPALCIVQTDHSDYAIIMDEHSNGYSGTLIAVGAIVMVVGLVGCIGTLKENRTLLVVVSYIIALCVCGHGCMIGTGG